jgi:hypothetical protein
MKLRMDLFDHTFFKSLIAQSLRYIRKIIDFIAF